MDSPSSSSSAEFVEVVLSCGSAQEAQSIADTLLSKHLVACVEFFPIRSRYWWKADIQEAEEIKLIMQSRLECFESIENIVNELHSYETPSLHALPIAIISEASKEWLRISTESE